MPRYQKGQQVIVKAGSDETSSSRESALENYEGHLGKIVEYYWINVGPGSPDFYVYQVKMSTDNEIIVVHEDEMEAAY